MRPRRLRRCKKRVFNAKFCQRAAARVPARHQFRKQRDFFGLEFAPSVAAFAIEELAARFSDYDLLLHAVRVMGGNMARNTSPTGAR